MNCIQDTPQALPEPTDPLYQCLDSDISGMEPGELERTIADFKAHPPACIAVDPLRAEAPPAGSALTTDSIRYHYVVMDEQCRFVVESTVTFPVSQQPWRHDFHWDGKIAGGAPAPTGIYHYNLEYDTVGTGNKHIGHSKIGYVSTACLPQVSD